MIAKAGLEGLTFHDLRGSTVTRLALEGAPPQEIASVTGHSIAFRTSAASWTGITRYAELRIRGIQRCSLFRGVGRSQAENCWSDAIFYSA